MTIRPIQDTDYNRVEELITDTIKTTVAQDYPSREIERMLETDPYQPHKTRRERDYFVATDGGIIGIIGRQDNMVKTFFVDPSQQGKGVGAALLTYIENVIQKDGYTDFTVNATQTAKSFYEKHGYIVTEKKEKRVGDTALVKYAMEKSTN